MVDINGLCCPVKKGLRPGNSVFGGVQDDEGIVAFHICPEIRDDGPGSGDIGGEFMAQRFQKDVDSGFRHGLPEEKRQSHTGSGTVPVRVLVSADSDGSASFQLL